LRRRRIITGKHLSRKELLMAARRKGEKISGHLAECQECREAVSLLAMFDMAGRLPLPNAGEGMIQRAASIAMVKPKLGRVKEFLAELIFDSWTVPHPIGVRGEGALEHRRIRFQSESTIIDFRAEQKQTGWNFIAQFGIESVSNSILIAEKLKLNPDKHGICQWVGKKPPRNMMLLVGDKIIKLPELTWKKPRKK
jgi:hypothetical protein